MTSGGRRRGSRLPPKHCARAPAVRPNGFIRDAAHETIRLIANHPDERDGGEYARKDREAREDHHIPPEEELLFFEVSVVDPSEFEAVLRVRGEEVDGHRVLRAESASVANATAAFLLWVRDATGQVPHVYFGWGEANPLMLLVRFLIFGEGDIPPLRAKSCARPSPTRSAVLLSTLAEMVRFGRTAGAPGVPGCAACGAPPDPPRFSG